MNHTLGLPTASDVHTILQSYPPVTDKEELVTPGRRDGGETLLQPTMAQSRENNRSSSPKSSSAPTTAHANPAVALHPALALIPNTPTNNSFRMGGAGGGPTGGSSQTTSPQQAPSSSLIMKNMQSGLSGGEMGSEQFGRVERSFSTDCGEDDEHHRHLDPGHHYEQEHRRYSSVKYVEDSLTGCLNLVERVTTFYRVEDPRSPGAPGSENNKSSGNNSTNSSFHSNVSLGGGWTADLCHEKARFLLTISDPALYFKEREHDLIEVWSGAINAQKELKMIKDAHPLVGGGGRVVSTLARTVNGNDNDATAEGGSPTVALPPVVDYQQVKKVGIAFTRFDRAMDSVFLWVDTLLKVIGAHRGLQTSPASSSAPHIFPPPPPPSGGQGIGAVSSHQHQQQQKRNLMDVIVHDVSHQFNKLRHRATPFLMLPSDEFALLEMQQKRQQRERMKNATAEASSPSQNPNAEMLLLSTAKGDPGVVETAMASISTQNKQTLVYYDTIKKRYILLPHALPMCRELVGEVNNEIRRLYQLLHFLNNGGSGDTNGNVSDGSGGFLTLQEQLEELASTSIAIYPRIPLFEHLRNTLQLQLAVSEAEDHTITHQYASELLKQYHGKFKKCSEKFQKLVAEEKEREMLIAEKRREEAGNGDDEKVPPKWAQLGEAEKKQLAQSAAVDFISHNSAKNGEDTANFALPPPLEPAGGQKESEQLPFAIRKSTEAKDPLPAAASTPPSSKAPPTTVGRILPDSPLPEPEPIPVSWKTVEYDNSNSDEDRATRSAQRKSTKPAAGGGGGGSSLPSTPLQHPTTPLKQGLTPPRKGGAPAPSATLSPAPQLPVSNTLRIDTPHEMDWRSLVELFDGLRNEILTLKTALNKDITARREAIKENAKLANSDPKKRARDQLMRFSPRPEDRGGQRSGSGSPSSRNEDKKEGSSVFGVFTKLAKMNYMCCTAELPPGFNRQKAIEERNQRTSLANNDNPPPQTADDLYMSQKIVLLAKVDKLWEKVEKLATLLEARPQLTNGYARNWTVKAKQLTMSVLQRLEGVSVVFEAAGPSALLRERPPELDEEQ